MLLKELVAEFGEAEIDWDMIVPNFQNRTKHFLMEQLEILKMRAAKGKISIKPN
jgi:hypothetical protein